MLYVSVDRVARWRMVAMTFAVVLVLSACGSTVQWSDTIAEGGPGGSATEDGLSVAEGDRRVGDVALGTAAAGSDSASDASGTPGARASGTPGARASGTPGARASGTPGARAPGVTDDEIYIGVTTFDDLDEFAASQGMDIDRGDTRAQTQAIVKNINTRGGVAGRKIVPVFHNISAAEATNDPNAAKQAACVHWTEDRPVFAAVWWGAGDGPNSCMAKRQTALIYVNVGLQHPQSAAARFAPYLYGPNLVTIERLPLAWLRRAAVLGYFDGGWDIDSARPGPEPTKIGILSARTQYGPDFRRTVRQELARQGRTATAEHEFAGGASALSEFPNAAVKFRNAGVTHIIAQNFLVSFVPYAAEQGYYPRYTISSIHKPDANLRGYSRAMVGAVGVGFAPLYDVGNEQDPGDVSAAQTRCREVMKRAGQNTSGRSAWATMAMLCEGFNFLAAAIDRGGLSPQGVYRGTQAIGSMPAASTFRMSFPGGRTDGASAVRDLGFREECGEDGCFKYLSSKNHGM